MKQVVVLSVKSYSHLHSALTLNARLHAGGLLLHEAIWIPPGWVKLVVRKSDRFRFCSKSLTNFMTDCLKNDSTLRLFWFQINISESNLKFNVEHCHLFRNYHNIKSAAKLAGQHLSKKGQCFVPKILKMFTWCYHSVPGVWFVRSESLENWETFTDMREHFFLTVSTLKCWQAF